MSVEMCGREARVKNFCRDVWEWGNRAECQRRCPEERNLGQNIRKKSERENQVGRLAITVTERRW
jgi:hypothetical protein